MSLVKAKGKRIVRTVGSFSIYDYRSPGINFECDKVLNHPKELAKLSGEVKTYKRGEIQK